MKTLEGKVAVVTGAAQGMGLETSCELARRGATVVLADVNRQKMEQAVQSARTAGKACSYGIDVSHKDEWLQMVSDTERRFGPVDILINNAAIFTVKPFE